MPFPLCFKVSENLKLFNLEKLVNGERGTLVTKPANTSPKKGHRSLFRGGFFALGLGFRVSSVRLLRGSIRPDRRF